MNHWANRTAQIAQAEDHLDQIQNSSINVFSALLPKDFLESL